MSARKSNNSSPMLPKSATGNNSRATTPKSRASAKSPNSKRSNSPPKSGKDVTKQPFMNNEISDLSKSNEHVQGAELEAGLEVQDEINLESTENMLENEEEQPKGEDSLVCYC